MSKKSGNFYTLRDLLKQNIDPIAIRFLLLSTHYRAQFNFTFEALEGSRKAVERLRNFIRRLHDANGQNSEGKVEEATNNIKTKFCSTMDDDLNVSGMLAVLFDFVREINNLLDMKMVCNEEAKKIILIMKEFDSVLGVIGKVDVDTSLPMDILVLIKQRDEARKLKNWKRSDEIRDQLKKIGIIIEDTSQGTKWHSKKK